MKAISIPFRFSSDTGEVSSTNSVVTTIENQIIDILTTQPGERVMHPEYGAGLRSLLFEEADPLIFAEYKMDAMQELNDYLTVGKVVDMEVTVPQNTLYLYDDKYLDDDNTTITVSVRYAVPPFGASVVTFNLSNSDTTLLGGTF